VKIARPRLQWLPIIKELSAIDIVIIVTILCSGIVFWVLQLLNKNNNQTFTIYKDNEVYYQGILSRNATIPVDTLAVIEVKHGQVKFANSNCKNQICIRQGWSHNNTLVCAPNKIYVTFQGKQEEVFITR